MDRMKTFFKYFIIVLAFYIISNVAIGLMFKMPSAKANDKYSEQGNEQVQYTEINWEELSHDPFFWFIALGGLIATLP